MSRRRRARQWTSAHSETGNSIRQAGRSGRVVLDTRKRIRQSQDAIVFVHAGTTTLADYYVLADASVTVRHRVPLATPFSVCSRKGVRVALGWRRVYAVEVLLDRDF